MLLRRKIEIEMEEKDGILSFIQQDDDVTKMSLLEYFTKKLQEAFDFGFSEGKKEKEN